MFTWILIGIVIGTPLVIITSRTPGISVSPWVPTDKKAKKRVITLAQLTEHDTVIDLGCGNGVLLVEAYKQTRCNVIGIECAPLQFTLARINFALHRVKGTLLRQDLFEADISQATVVFLYLLPAAMVKLKPILQKSLAKGTRIVSYTFPFEDWEPKAVDWPTDQMPVYVYTIT